MTMAKMSWTRSYQWNAREYVKIDLGYNLRNNVFRGRFQNSHDFGVGNSVQHSSLPYSSNDCRVSPLDRSDLSNWMLFFVFFDGFWNAGRFAPTSEKAARQERDPKLMRIVAWKSLKHPIDCRMECRKESMIPLSFERNKLLLIASLKRNELLELEFEWTKWDKTVKTSRSIIR